MYLVDPITINSMDILSFMGPDEKVDPCWAHILVGPHCCHNVHPGHPSTAITWGIAMLQ